MTDAQQIRARATVADRQGRSLIERGQIEDGTYMLGKADALREVADLLAVRQLEAVVTC